MLIKHFSRGLTIQKRTHSPTRVIASARRPLTGNVFVFANVSSERRRAHLKNEAERIAADAARAMLRALLSRPNRSVPSLGSILESKRTLLLVEREEALHD